jgi:GTP cyclohydrolase II
VEQVSLRVPASPFNQRYLETKQEKMGHTLEV